MKKGLLFLAFCLICPEVLATVFSVSPTDKSQQYLGMIFGSSVGAINLVGESYNATLSLMFERFNFIIVTVGALTLSYLGIVSTINTAREGEAMGKKISMWVPMRAFTGMLLMVPGPTSGYSVVQMTVLWVILNGIGAANSIWNVVLAQLSQGVSVTAGITLPDLTSNDIVKYGLFANTCMYAVNSIANDTSNPPNLATVPGPYQQFGPVKIYTKTNPAIITPSPGPGIPESISQNAYLMVGLEGAPAPYNTLCGQFTISTSYNSNDAYNVFDIATATQLTTAKLAATQAIFTATDAAAQLMASKYPYTDANNYVKPEPGYIYAAIKAYIGQMSQIAQPTKKVANSINSTYANLSQVGWIHAGSYYFEMVKGSTITPNPQATTLPSTNAIPSNMDTVIPANAQANWTTTGGQTTAALVILSDAQIKQLNTGLQNANDYYTNDPVGAPASVGLAVSNASTGNKFLDAIVGSVRDGLQNKVIGGLQDLTSGSNPLIKVGTFGTALMVGAEIATFASILVGFFLSLAGSAASCMNPLPYAIIVLVLQIFPVILGVFTMMWSMGATLGIYVPLIPYMIFTTSAFGWIIAVIEAVVAAPLIALGLTHPSGEELGKATSALVILANLFLRPTLMIFGFVMAGSLLNAGIAFINYGFLPALNSATTPSMFSILAVLGMYVSLIIAIVNKSFSLVYMLPNQIMRWMGGPTENFDPSDMTKQAKEGFDSGASKGQAIGDAANKSASDKGSQAAEKNANAKKVAGDDVKPKGGK